MPVQLKQLSAKLQRKLHDLRHAEQGTLFEVWEQQHLSRLFDYAQVDCVFDVGANEGQYATMLRQKAGYKGLILSFEPNPEAAAVLRKAAEGDALWHVEEIALSDADGQQTFNVMSSSEFSSLSAPSHDDTDRFRHQNVVAKSFEVRTERVGTALERLRAQHRFERPFLKLDTQGYDVHIVRAAGPAMSAFIGLQSELAVKKLYADAVDFREALSAYEQAGFELSAFVPNNEGHFPLLMEIDCIMVRRGLQFGGT